LYSQLQTTGEATLHVEIMDGSTGRIIPAMVCVTNLADGTWRAPANAPGGPKYTTARDFYFPLAWKPGDPGYVRLTNGEFNDNDVRSNIYKGISAYPFWREPAAYFVSKPFSMRLPVGKWRLAVERGLEYLPVSEEFQAKAGETNHRKIVLRRWVDMPARGWYSGDDHVHFPRTSPNNDEFLLTWARAEDVHMLNILRMGDIKQTYFEQTAYGKASHRLDGEYAMASGQEDPRDVLGHAIALDIPSPVRDVPQYLLYDATFDKVHEHGGITGYAHLAWSHPLDANVNVPRGKVDFAEILQFRRLGTDDYYDFLNLGFRLIASAGSDLPWGNTIGEARVYAYTGPKFSPELWYAAFRRGHTFVTNGPMLSLQAGNAIPGDEVKLHASDKLEIRVRAWAPAEIGLPQRLELVAGGQVIHAVESHDQSQRELRVDFRFSAEKSTWIAARVETQNGGYAHTSPIYIVVDEAPLVPTVELVQRRKALLDQIAPRLRGTSVPGLDNRIAEAAGVYTRMLTP
jgi:hypothetical protein